MKVLVTGGAGYLGSTLVRTLLACGHEVLVLDSLLYGGRSLLECQEDGRFHLVQGDIRSASVVQDALRGMEAVVHLAAIVGDPACARQPELAREVNLEASLQLVELSRRHGIQRFLFASTCSNYGAMSPDMDYVTEESELRPLSLYAKTKVTVERVLFEASTTEGPAVSVLRFATLFGLSPRMRFDLTVNEFTLELLTKRRVTVYAEQLWRPYVHVQDAADAIRLVLDSPRERVAAQAFNVGDTGQNYQKGQLVNLIREQIGEKTHVEYVRTAPDLRNYRVSFEKIRRQLGFRIRYTVEAGVRELIDAINHGVVTNLEDASYRN